MPPEFRLFGGLSLIANGQLVSGAASQPRRVAVLAVLAEAYPAAVTRDRIVGLIWPEQDEAGARRLLTQALYELRRELGPVTVAGGGRDVSLDASAIHVDLIAFRRAIQAGDATRALELYRGPLLDGFHLRDAVEFERWASTARDAAQRDLQTLIDAAVDRAMSQDDVRAAARLAQRAAEVAPHDAAAALRAIDLLDRAGDPGAATRVANLYATRMRDDLELPPDEIVLRRAERIGAAEPSRVTPAIPIVTALSPEPVTQARPGTHTSTPRRSSRWKTPVGLGVAALLAIGMRASWKSSHVPENVIALEHFEARGDDQAARASSALGAMLVANLDRAGGKQVDTSISRGRSLRGVVTSTGDQVRIDAELEVPHADPVRASVDGPRDSLIVLAERLSLALLPAFYDNLNTSAKAQVTRIRSVAAARHYLDGESALARAAFDSAYDAMRAATEADSANAYLWYRRAVTAEEAHRIDDADRSALRADATRAGLAPRAEQLVHAYAVWRSGDGRSADSLYRDILQTQPLDPEAWFHFAEVSYHGATLFGRPLDAARDAWRRAVSLDTNSFPALMHAVRLEARAGNDSALKALLARADRIQAREPYRSEARAIAAASGTRTLSREDLRALDAMPDASLQFVHSIVASFVERPDVAWEVASRLIEPKRPDAVRAEGYLALAHLAMAGGRTPVAMAMLDSLAPLNAVSSAWARAYFAALPFVPIDTAAINAAAKQLASVPARATAAPLYLELSVDGSIADLIRRYDTAILEAKAGKPVAVKLGCSEFAEPHERSLCFDLERGVTAATLARAGRDADALRVLESMEMRVPYQLAGRSVYYARTRERFLRAQLLERAGRLDEAYDWYAGVSHTARLDYVFLAASHEARGRIRERQGDARGAAAHYARAKAIQGKP